MGRVLCVAQDKSYLVDKLPLACQQEQAAFEFLEEQRWGDLPQCPRCESPDVFKMTDKATGGRSSRFLWHCRECNRQYTVRIGTVFEDSRIPLRHWVLGFWMVCSSKKGISALQVKRLTGLSYKSTLFMMHRIRKALHEPLEPQSLRGVVEIDETYVGGRERGRLGRGTKKKVPVMAMVERGGRARPFPITDVTAKTLKGAVRQYVHPSATIMTDDFSSYRGLNREFEGGHQTVRHSRGEYVRGLAYTNTVESFFALLKRGIYGTFHSVSRKHLHRYCSEFEFRHNNRDCDDGERTARAIRAAEGKRLTYKQQVGHEQ